MLCLPTIVTLSWHLYSIYEIGMTKIYITKKAT